MLLSIGVHPKPKSFDIVIYDAAKQELARYQIPLALAVPLANRIAREGLYLTNSLSEPWYTVDARSDLQLQRSPLPEGPTSLRGDRYIPNTDLTISMHPDASYRYFEVLLFDFERELFRGIYTMDDIFLHGAHYLLRNGIRKGEWFADRGPYFYSVVPDTRLLSSASSDLFTEGAYRSEGLFRLPLRA